MKKETAGAAEKSENPSAKQAPAKVARKKTKAVKMRKVEKQADGVRLPVLVEFTYTISVLLLLLLGLTVMFISFVSGASLLNLVLRTSVTILVIGALLTLISAHISTGVLNACLVEQEEFEKAQSEESQNSPSIENPGTVEA